MLTAAGPYTLSMDGDVALHVLLGQQMWARRGWLPTEPTSWAVPDRPFIAHEWLAELGMAGLYAALGFAGVLLAAMCVVAGLEVALYRRCREVAGTWATLIAVLLAIPVVNSHLLARPHLLTWVFAFAYHGVAERVVAGKLDGKRFVAIVAAGMVVWANVHGGFLFGLGLLALHAGAAALDAGSRPRVPVLVAGFAAAAVASLLNPWGWATHLHFFAWLRDPLLMGITSEFAAPSLANGALIPLSALIGALLLGWTLRWPTWREVAIGLILGGLALNSGRHAPLFALIVVPWIAAGLQGVVDAIPALKASSQRLDADEEGAMGAVWPLALVVGLILGRQEIDFDPEVQPVDAAGWIAAHPEAVGDRMFDEFDWGAYLAFRLWPEHLVYVNSWHDHLGHDVIASWLAIEAGGPDAVAKVDALGIDWAVIRPDAPLAMTLESVGWKPVYVDATAIVLVK
jgi:hypothetical protein